MIDWNEEIDGRLDIPNNFEKIPIQDMSAVALMVIAEKLDELITTFGVAKKGNGNERNTSATKGE